MPTVFRKNGFRFYFWSREPNEPAHVQVDRAGASAKLWLQPTVLASNTGFAAHELGDILRLTRHHQIELLEAWNEFFSTG